MHKEAWCGMWVKYSRALYVSSGRVHNCQCVTSLGLLCYIVSLLKDMSTHTFAHKHRRTSNAWHINEGMETDMWCSVIYTHIHRHTKGPEDGVRLVTVPFPVSVSVSPEEWGRVPSGDTQPVITKWHKWPTFPSSTAFLIISALSSKFLYLILPSSDSVMVSVSQHNFETLYSNKM